jgi:parallel beta helix pectate lyase-like protein
MKRWVGTALAAASVIAGFTVAAPAAHAAPVVTCGSYLEENASLTRDLSCPNGVGVYLALDVTLDLRGHKIIGPGATSATGPGIGVTVSPVHPSRVINGTITGWPTAIGGNEDFETVESADLSGLRLVGNGTAVVANQAYLTVENSVIRGNTTGITAQSRGELGSRITVTGSTFRDNGTAVQVDPRTTVSLSDNVFRGNDVGYTVTAGLPDGYPVTYSATLERNSFIANGDAIRVTTPGTSLGDNTARRNTGWGIYAPGATDLGGNVSRGNGNSPQCVGVVC